jgi:hypothetical protein
MRKRVLGAILLPLPFAALPVIVVLLGAVFGPGDSDELVTREDATQVTQEFVSTEAPHDPEISLTRATTRAGQFEPDCGDELLSES